MQCLGTDFNLGEHSQFLGKAPFTSNQTNVFLVFEEHNLLKLKEKTKHKLAILLC